MHRATATLARVAARAPSARASVPVRNFSAPAPKKVNFEKDSVVGKTPYIIAGAGIVWSLKSMAGPKPAKKTEDEVSDFAALKAERVARLDDISASIQAAEKAHAEQIKSLTEEAAALRSELSA